MKDEATTQESGKTKGSYEVGRNKPPMHTRFKKGQSGNPKGPPKGTVQLKTRLKEFLLSKSKSGKTYEELFIQALGQNAIALRKERTQQLIWESLEGKATQAVDLTSKGEKIGGEAEERVKELSSKFDEFIKQNDAKRD